MTESVLLAEAKSKEILDLSLETAVEYMTVPRESNLYTPTDTLAAISAAMTLIRHKIDTPPVTEPINLTLATTTEEKVFSELVNQMIGQPRHTSKNEIIFTQKCSHQNPGACPDAEPLFTALLRARKYNAREFKLGEALVFHDDIQQPILLQKFIGADSALGLQPVNIDGITYPSGTLYSVYSDRGHALHKRYMQQYKNPKQLTVRQLSTAEVDSISPLRLSLFGIPPHERVKHRYHETIDKYEPYERKLIELVDRVKIDDFRKAFAK